MSHINIPFNNAHFTQSAEKLSQCPSDHGVEVAFAGRSNAGKSSAINALTGVGKLARISKTPGRTQLINFFAFDDHPRRLVDLPGYGYAKVPIAVKEKWQRYLDEYLQGRTSLIGLVLVMDIRRPLTEYDQMMLSWAKASNMPTHILLTKADKLKRGPAQSCLLQVRKELAEMGDLVTIQTFSALKRSGVDTVRAKLIDWLQLPMDESELS